MNSRSLALAACAAALFLLAPAVASANLTLLNQWGSAGTGPGQFQLPSGVAVDRSGNVYVADSNNDRVQRFDSNGNFLGSFGAPGVFNGPGHMGIDPQGNPIVVDEGNYRVVKYSPAGQLLVQYGSFGGGPGQFSGNPHGAATDAAGNVYAVDVGGGGKINVYAPDGTFLRTWGGAGSAPGQFQNPHGIAVSPSGDVYVGNAGNYRIDVFRSNGTFVRSFGDPVGAPGHMNDINEVALDSAGNVWIDDSVQGIYEYSPTGVFLQHQADTGRSQDPFRSYGIAIGPGDDVYATDVYGSRVLRFSQSAPPPELGKTAAVQKVTGTVLVKAPGSTQFVELSKNTAFPLGSIVDTTHGAVSLDLAKKKTSSAVQTGTFSKGKFRITQRGSGLTQLALTGGGNFARCQVGGAHASRRRRRPHRHLFSSVHGRFRTRGRYSSATVRGTRWLQKDTCAGTLTVVKRGTVVVRDFAKHKSVRVRKGHRYLARPPHHRKHH